MKKLRKIRMLLLLMILTILLSGIFIINGVKLYIVKSSFKESVEKIMQEYEYCSNVTFQGDYVQNITINMNNEFEKFDYDEKEQIISTINSNIENEFQNYLNKIKKEVPCNVLLYVNDNIYTYNNITKTIKRNGKDYNLQISLKEKIYNKIHDSSYNSYINDLTDIEVLKGIVSIDNIDECKKEIIYLSAIKIYEKGEFEDSINEFNKIEGTYKEKNEYLAKGEVLKQIQGTYRASYINLIVINKWDITFGIDPKYNTQNYLKEYTFNYTIENNEIVLTRKLTIQEIGRGIKERYNYDINNQTLSGDKYETYYYESNNINFPERLKEPAIGMTKTEAENSTWGKPNKINTTTTVYGIHEQWVYGNGRYLYFDNEKLTSIQK